VTVEDLWSRLNAEATWRESEPPLHPSDPEEEEASDPEKD
jgi:hypothetical protein